jgi:hypothetical protein
MNEAQTPQQYHDIMRKAIRAYDLLDKEPKTVKEPIWMALVAGLELAQVYMMEEQQYKESQDSSTDKVMN